MSLPKLITLGLTFLLHSCLATQYAVDVKTFPTDFEIPEFTGALVLPTPTFPMAVCENVFSSISVHQSGSFHFEPFDRCCNRRSTTASSTNLCVTQCSLDDSQQIYTALFPLYQPSGDPSDSTNYKTTKQYFSNSTLYILDMETTIQTTNTKHVMTFLIPPSTMAVYYVESSDSPQFSSINTFSGLIKPKGSVSWPSPRLTADSSVFNDNISASGVVAPPASALEEGHYSLFCSLGSSFCAYPLTIQPSDAISITTNGDNSCYRKDKSPVLAALAGTPPDIICTFSSSGSAAINSTAIYDQLANTFKCRVPAAEGAYTLSLAVASLTADPSSDPQPLYLSSDGAEYFDVTVSSSAAATGDQALDGGEGSDDARYECGCASNRWALSTGGRGAKASYGNGTDNVWWGDTYVNSDTYSRDYCFQDCAGEFGGLAVLDPCGVCVRGNTGLEWGATTDCQGQCGGSDTSCVEGGSVTTGQGIQVMRAMRTAARLLGLGTLATDDEDTRTDAEYIFETLDMIDIYKYICTVLTALGMIYALIMGSRYRKVRQIASQTAPSPQAPLDYPMNAGFSQPVAMRALRPTGHEARRNIDISIAELDTQPPVTAAEVNNRRNARRDYDGRGSTGPSLVANPVRTSYSRAAPRELRDPQPLSRQTSGSGQGNVQSIAMSNLGSSEDRFHDMDRQGSFRLGDAPSPRSTNDRMSRDGTPRRGTRLRDTDAISSRGSSPARPVDLSGVGVQLDGSPRRDDVPPRRPRSHRQSRSRVDGEVDELPRRSRRR